MPENRDLIVATREGVAVCRRQGEDWHVVHRGLLDQNVTSVIAREGVILAGTTDGLYRSDDAGASWVPADRGLSTRHLRWLAYHPTISDREFAGTEPAGIFVSTDGGASWRACDEVANLRDSFGWSLPYSPEAGCVRGFAFHGQRAYAAVEVGGLLRSDDCGATWALAPGSRGEPSFGPPPAGFLPADVHSVEVHPSSPDLVFAATHEGLYRSTDGAQTWTRIHAGYTRAFWLDPDDPGHVIAGPAAGVDRGGTVRETRDGGLTWQDAATGLGMPWPADMVERLVAVGDEILAVRADGAVFAAQKSDMVWRRVLGSLAGVTAVAGW
jgi:photosystem II stability/assembly factor-like uncharacterized protein